MKIGGPNGAGGVAPPGVGRRPVAAGGFAPTGAAESAHGAAPANAAASAGPVSGLEALLALQDVGGPLERRRRAIARGGRLLDDLDRVKLALLDGGDGRSALVSLRDAVMRRREGSDDAALEGVLDQIDLRAAVELAKAEMGRAA